MSFAESLPQDPWAAVLDWLLARGYADETISGDINNKKSFALETLVGPSGKIGLSYVHLLSNQPTDADIYAYWLRVARVSGLWELRTFSRDTGYHDRVTVTGSISQTLDALEREVEAANKKHTERRRRSEPAPKWPGEWMEFEMTPEQNPIFVAPSPELRLALSFYYNKLGGKDLRGLSGDQKRELMANVKIGIQEAQRHQAAVQHRSSEAGCFVGGTAVITPTGARAISSIGVGDVVLGLGDDGLGWSRVRSSRVVRTAPIAVETTRGTVRVTADHRLVGPSGATPAGSLTPGALLYTATTDMSLGHAVVLDVLHARGSIEPCYNLYLDAAAVFVANGICAHSFGRLPLLRATVWRWVHRLEGATSLSFERNKRARGDR